ncbi:MAG: fused MFS/spermidine synthase [Nitrospirota bacterium]
MRSSIPFVIMGLTSMLLQITVLRLLLSTFSGNELDIGITLSFWLIFVGIGSFTGSKIKARQIFPISFLLIAFLTLPTAFAIRAIRSVLSLNPGEVVSLSSIILSTSISLFPLCFTAGVQFPLAVLYSGTTAGKIYGLEAIGAFIGGILFTFVIASRINATELCLLISLLNILIAAYVSEKKIITVSLVIPLSVYLGFHKIASALPWQGLEPYKTVESQYGEITVIKVRNQSSLYINGHLLFSYPDMTTEEMSSHMAMTLHPLPWRILVIGGSPGTLKEFLKYPIKSVDFVELDKKIIDVSLELLNLEDRNAVEDRRVKIIIEDGRKIIKGLKEPAYDLIVLNLPPPSTAGINRFYTTDFFKEVKAVLKEKGILAMTMPQSTGYIGRSMQTVNGAIYNSLKSVFRYVEVTAQEYGDLFGSDYPIIADPEILEERFVRRHLRTGYFNQYILRDAFVPLNVDYVRNRLDEIKFINEDLRPSAYLYNLLLWSEIHGGMGLKYLLKIKGRHFIIISIVAILAVSSLIFMKKKRVIYYSIFTTGFSGMSFMVVIILLYQALYGYVYEMIGILSAMFMIGLWFGVYLSGFNKDALRTLFYLEILTITLALISPIFFKSELLFYLLSLLSGAITGGQFSTSNQCMNEPHVAGRLYGLDLIGSFSGAFIPAIIMLPLFGVFNTLLSIVVMKVASAAMILSLGSAKD